MKTILIIDENEDWKDMYTDLCNASFGESVEIDWCYTYAQAIPKLVKNNTYDVIIFNPFVFIENSLEMGKSLMLEAHSVNQNVIVLETMIGPMWIHAEQHGVRVRRTDKIWTGHKDELIGCFDEKLNLVEYNAK